MREADLEVEKVYALTAKGRLVTSALTLTQQWEARAQRARTQEKTAPLTRALKLRHEADVLEDCARELRALLRKD